MAAIIGKRPCSMHSKYQKNTKIRDTNKVLFSINLRSTTLPILHHSINSLLDLSKFFKPPPPQTYLLYLNLVTLMEKSTYLGQYKKCITHLSHQIVLVFYLIHFSMTNIHVSNLISTTGILWTSDPLIAKYSEL